MVWWEPWCEYLHYRNWPMPHICLVFSSRAVCSITLMPLFSTFSFSQPKCTAELPVPVHTGPSSSPLSPRTAALSMWSQCEPTAAWASQTVCEGLTLPRMCLYRSDFPHVCQLQYITTNDAEACVRIQI